jgi:hypothetical protein
VRVPLASPFGEDVLAGVVKFLDPRPWYASLGDYWGTQFTRPVAEQRDLNLRRANSIITELALDPGHADLNFQEERVGDIGKGAMIGMLQMPAKTVETGMAVGSAVSIAQAGGSLVGSVARNVATRLAAPRPPAPGASVGPGSSTVTALSRQDMLLQGIGRNTVVLDENVFFMEQELARQGYTVVKVPVGATDAAIQRGLASTGARFVTRNYGHFRGLEGVIRVSGKTPIENQLITTVNSLEISRVNPEVFLRMKQIPASGINKGLVKPPK